MCDFYGENKFILERALDEMLGKVDLLRKYNEANGKRNPIEHCKGRIKSEDSMKDKLRRKGLSVNLENAMTKVNDAVGIRIICSFVDDVYEIVNLLKSLEDIEIVKEKDYIDNPKVNGYRSYHMIVKLKISIPEKVAEVLVEIQIRTIAQDSWAALEHQLKYKHDVENVELIQKELKRCADEMASTDLSLQTVREMISNT